ncbi:hypothetical protein OG279_37455 (plasmid) [Streptomyces sp. NBC_01201]|uniref:hypothetical protein n=1 Tax=Streptomyces sp. NBC_01201 TaxID=2903770 RepID=UPI002E0E993C|nr:hypothetical protein OG279_37455 [Streptomyces sp. NBC_01201]
MHSTILPPPLIFIASRREGERRLTCCIPAGRVEERWRFGFLAPEEAGQHRKGGTLNLGNEGVKPCLNEPVRTDMPTECPLLPDVAQLFEGVIAGHRSLLGRRLGTEGSHICRRCCIAFLFSPTMLTDDLLRGLPLTTSTSTPRTDHTNL